MNMDDEDPINPPEELHKLRRIHNPAANEGKGRSITSILYDRSIRGPYGIGGKRPLFPSFSRGVGNRRRSISQASPSSVMGVDEEDEDEREVIDEEEEESMQDSLSQILRGEDSLLLQRSNAASLVQDLDSLSEVLNGSPPSSVPPPTSSSTTISEPALKPPTKRLKLNAYPTCYTKELSNYAETASSTRFHWDYLTLAPSTPSLHTNDPTIPPRQQNNPDWNQDASTITTQNERIPTLSTISVAFSGDGKTLASTHGDHSVKISCCNTGRLIRNLEGHPRTPWTVKFHPTNSYIVASGCLGFQVRVWHWNYGDEEEEGGEEVYGGRQGVCLTMIRLSSSIISLSFHPQGQILAIASGRFLHLWAYEASNDQNKGNTNREGPNTNETANRSGYGSNVMTQIRYENALRCVHFPPGGDTLILGMVNRQGGHDNIYSLRLWDFDLEAALHPNLYLQGPQGTEHLRDGGGSREVLSNFRTILKRAILYNDGGLDISADGKHLCGCAEYWLPFGKNSIMEEIEEENEKSEAIKFNSLQMTTGNDSEGGSGSSGIKNKQQSPLWSSQSGKKKKIQRDNRLSLERNNSEKDATSPNPSQANQLPQFFNCRTPPNTGRPQIPTTPPAPPGRRYSGMQNNSYIDLTNGIGNGRISNHGPPPPPLPPSHQNHLHHHSERHNSQTNGRFVPHVVTVNLDSNDEFPVLEATPLGSKATSVTCVKFSPSAEYCLLGYGVRDNSSSHDQNYHPVTSIYRIKGGMVNVATMLSDDDDVNIARFHPDSGHGFVYGTKQGRVRILSPRPWTYYSY